MELLDKIRVDMGDLYCLVDLLSELDVLQSLAVISSARNYVKPSFGNFTEIEDGIHPLLEHLHSVTPVPNTIVSINPIFFAHILYLILKQIQSVQSCNFYK